MSALAAPDEETIVNSAVAELDQRLPAVRRSHIEPVVRRIVHRWFERARIRTFIGIIAVRQARAELETEEPSRP